MENSYSITPQGERHTQKKKNATRTKNTALQVVLIIRIIVIALISTFTYRLMRLSSIQLFTPILKHWSTQNRLFFPPFLSFFLTKIHSCENSTRPIKRKPSHIQSLSAFSTDLLLSIFPHPESIPHPFTWHYKHKHRPHDNGVLC